MKVAKDSVASACVTVQPASLPEPLINADHSLGRLSLSYRFISHVTQSTATKHDSFFYFVCFLSLNLTNTIELNRKKEFY